MPCMYCGNPKSESRCAGKEENQFRILSNSLLVEALGCAKCVGGEDGFVVVLVVLVGWKVGGDENI